MGWREFIRGVYQTRSQNQIGKNFFKNDRKLTNDWYEGTTGIDPLDDAIKLTLKHGYTHHINRLMVISPWCDIVDGLYWSFIKNNLDYFKTNPRLAVMPRALERLKPERKELIFSASEKFIQEKTS